MHTGAHTQPQTRQNRSRALPDGLQGVEIKSGATFAADWLTSLNAIVRNGWGAGLADGVQTLTGRPPLRFADFVRGHAHVWR
jgi:hypothetical protein